MKEVHKTGYVLDDFICVKFRDGFVFVETDQGSVTSREEQYHLGGAQRALLGYWEYTLPIRVEVTYILVGVFPSHL